MDSHKPQADAGDGDGDEELTCKVGSIVEINMNGVVLHETLDHALHPFDKLKAKGKHRLAVICREEAKFLVIVDRTITTVGGRYRGNHRTKHLYKVIIGDKMGWTTCGFAHTSPNDKCVPVWVKEEMVY